MIPNWWLIKKRRINALPTTIVANPSVELGTSEPAAWFHSTNTEWVSGDAADGDKSLRINVNGATADWRTALFTIAPGWHRFGLSVKGQGDIVTVLAFRWFSDVAGNDYVGEQWLVLDQNYSDWRAVDEHIEVPATTIRGDLMFRAAFTTTVDVLGDLFFVEPVETFNYSFEFDSMHNSGYLGWL